MARRGTSTVLWERSSSTAFVVDAHGAVSELRIPFADEGVDFIDSWRGGDVSFLTQRGPVVARHVGFVATHRLYQVPGTEYWLTIEEMTVGSLLIMGVAVVLATALGRLIRSARSI